MTTLLIVMAVVICFETVALVGMVFLVKSLMSMKEVYGDIKKKDADPPLEEQEHESILIAATGKLWHIRDSCPNLKSADKKKIRTFTRCDLC